METGQKSSLRIHPLVATAAISVTLASLLGVAAMTGLLPSSHSSSAPTSTPAATTANAVQPLAAPPANNMAANQLVPETSVPQTAPPAAPSHKAPKAVAQAAPVERRVVCDNCGKVESVHAIQQAAKPSGLGVAAGAVLGGILGNQIGNGNGRTLATVAGAVGGGYAGNEVEKRTRSTTGYQVHVRMDNGSVRTFSFAEQPAWAVGDRVKVQNGTLVARN